MSLTKTRIAREWQAFWLAVGFLTRIPMPVPIDYSQKLMNQCSLYFPLVGLLLGALYALTFTLLSLTLSPLVSILLVLVLHLWLTGAFHEDGLADSIDALGGGYTVEKRLAIMKDSRIGTYGSVALVMAIALKAASLLSIDTVWLALLLAPALSRLTPLLIMGFLPYVTDPDQSKSKPVADGFSRARLCMAAAFCVVLLVPGSFHWPTLLFLAPMATVGVALSWGLYIRSQLGGYTGDTLGAAVILSELTLLVLISAA